MNLNTTLMLKLQNQLKSSFLEKKQVPDDLITRSFLEIEKYLTLNEKDYENTPALDSEEKDTLSEEKQSNVSNSKK